MVIKGNTILPEEGKILHRLSDDSYAPGFCGDVDASDFEEVDEAEYAAVMARRAEDEACRRRDERYGEAVVRRLRERYSADDELALVHNFIKAQTDAVALDDNPDEESRRSRWLEEYAAFQYYREVSKAQAAEEVANEEREGDGASV